MWYLDSQLKYIMLMAVFYIALSALYPKGAAFAKRNLFPAAFFVFLFSYNPYTGFLYIVAAFINFYTAKLILKSNHKKTLFIFSIIFNSVAFLIVSILPYFNTDILSFISFIGYAYAYLKLMDLSYYAYFYEEEMNIRDVLSFILFVPVFTSGPIISFNDYKNQIDTPQEMPELEAPVKRIIKGFFKKVVLIKLLYIFHDRLLEGELNMLLSLLVLFSFYIIGYLDFSGYSDIAIGFSKLMGFHIPENFKFPFLSPSLTIFWKNWHITLGAWIKSHISIFLKPKTRLQAAVSAFIIMLFIGVWHKFSLLFFLWGVWHGIFLFIEAYFNIGTVNKKKTKPLIYYARCFVTNLIVTLGCIFFSSDMDIVLKIFKGLFSL